MLQLAERKAVCTAAYRWCNRRKSNPPHRSHRRIGIAHQHKHHAHHNPLLGNCGSRTPHLAIPGRTCTHGQGCRNLGIGHDRCSLQGTPALSSRRPRTRSCTRRRHCHHTCAGGQPIRPQERGGRAVGGLAEGRVVIYMRAVAATCHDRSSPGRKHGVHKRRLASYQSTDMSQLHRARGQSSWEKASI